MSQRIDRGLHQVLTNARAIVQRKRAAGFTPSPGKRSRSTRGERREPWRTKKWTPCRRAEAKKALGI